MGLGLMLIERYKYGIRVFDPINSHYSFFIKDDEDNPGWCKILVQEDNKDLNVIEHKCVLKNRDLVELMPLLQEVLDYEIRNGEKLKIDQIVIVDKPFGP
ncbi:MAG: hypothetical protein RXP86_11915 [Acidilobus sp.]